jgi:hypothetical protein
MSHPARRAVVPAGARVSGRARPLAVVPPGEPWRGGAMIGAGG